MNETLLALALAVADLYEVPPYLLGIGRPHRRTWRLRRRLRMARRRLVQHLARLRQ